MNPWDEYLKSACKVIIEALEAYDYLTFGECRYEVKTQALIGHGNPTLMTRAAIKSLLDRGMILHVEDSDDEVYELRGNHHA